MKTVLTLYLAAWASLAGAVFLDRIAVTVDNDVITEAEVYEEIRVTAFQNGTRPDFSPAARRDAAERLVDQDLIRREMLLTHFPQPPEGDLRKVLDELKRSRFHGDDGAYRQALGQYGISGENVRAHLLWQISALRFTGYRFEQNAGGKANSVTDPDLDEWLKSSRSQARITFHEEAFQ